MFVIYCSLLSGSWRALLTQFSNCAVCSCSLRWALLSFKSHFWIGHDLYLGQSIIIFFFLLVVVIILVFLANLYHNWLLMMILKIFLQLLDLSHYLSRW